MLFAIGIVYSRFLERIVYTVLVALNSVPKVALAPLFVIWLGIGGEAKISVAVMLVLPNAPRTQLAPAAEGR